MEYLPPIHQQILDAIRQSGFIVIVDNHKVCKTNKYDGYTMTFKDPDNNIGKNTLLICNNVIRKNYDDWIDKRNRVLAHEAIHVAQICKSNDGHIETLGFRKDLEQEAIAVQDQPKEVLRIVKKYCL